MIRIVPAIDLIGGRCVRLTRGDYATKKVYDASPVETARRYADCGVQRIHLVDLDGAKASRPCNLAVLEQIAAAVSCELERRDCHHRRCGTGFLGRCHPRHRGQRGGFAAGAFRGVAEPMGLPHDPGGRCPADGGPLAGGREGLAGGGAAVAGCHPEAREAIVTDIGRDGMLQGPTTGLYVQLQAAFPQVTFTVSGGVSSMDDIRALDAAGLQKAIVGKALYENRITLKDIALWSQKESYPASM